ncbi:hypothetical protein F442_02989 [Phytophthora nicotianae P10297]|uniref:BZIP domain-containing protein n=1 Tax=Phytophthora nicotianae P10297 TaxID=1317064 RepID=W2ZY99_PHYNI|nr:hypothetical protein F442_02989 [Phytophthora nicotianae P10297]
MAAKSEAAATSNVVEMAPSHASAPASPLRTESTMTVAPIIFPSKGENDIRKRRKREPIKLPPWVRAKLSANDLRRLKKKKRISATRLRQRSQQLIQSLQDQLEHYQSL